MSKDKAISILLVEDNKEDCEMFKDYIESKEQIRLVDIVETFETAIEDIKTYLPDAIILDIELENSSGSGLDILKEIKKLNLDIRPIIVITTNTVSKRVHKLAHKDGADLIFTKINEKYSAELVIRNILNLSEIVISQKKYEKKESPNDFEERLSKRVNRELDLIGVGSYLVGRKYIHDAIMYILKNKETQESVFLYLAKLHKKENSTIGRSIQTAINSAWKKSSIEDLQKYYTAVVNYEKGVPTPVEFIFYYARKIEEQMK